MCTKEEYKIFHAYTCGPVPRIDLHVSFTCRNVHINPIACIVVPLFKYPIYDYPK